MDVLRHHRSLALLIFVLVTYFSVSSAEHPHRHHHGSRYRRQDQGGRHYYVEDVQVPEYGNWGPWTPTGECSRSCGGGVAFEIRQCLSLRVDGVPVCLGPSKRYYSCNIQDCPDPNFDFRAYQCSLFNSVPFDNQNYTWVPYTKAPNKCELNCMPPGERFYFRHKKQVIDGTPCDDEKPDICVNGRCLPVGCDRVLGSPAREDKCRICNGDGSSCVTKHEIVDKNDLVVGYNDLLLIPAGAMNLRIREVVPSYNYLAIRNLSGHYYLNGDWRIDYPKALRFVGTIFHYERTPSGFAGSESITALGPIAEPLYIVILYQDRGTRVEYEYSIHTGALRATDPDSYQWMYDEFSNCTATCGGGFKIRNVWCAKRRDSSPASADLCDPALQPIQNQTCGTEPCSPDWEYSEWSQCSHACGTNGTQNRTAKCKQIISNERMIEVDQYNCISRKGNPENTTRSCNVGLPCPKWYIGPWKACDKLCGDGVHRREVRCYYKIDGRISITQDSSCIEKKPDTEKPCFIRPCEGIDWILSEWSGCEDKCDLTFETRRAICATAKGKIYANEFCKKSKLPELVRNCTAVATCEYQWYATQWSECSSKCGAGVRSRKVFCGTLKNESIVKVDDTKCDLEKKYNTSENCTGTGICKGDWFASPWSACSKKCGGGTMTRKVLCFLENKTVDADNCGHEKIVYSSETCNDQACGEDEILPVVATSTVSEENTDEECEEYDDDNVVTITMASDLNHNKSLTGQDDLTTEMIDTTEAQTDMWSTTVATEKPTAVKSKKLRRRKRSVTLDTDGVTTSTEYSTDSSSDSSTVDSTTESGMTSTTDLSSTENGNFSTTESTSVSSSEATVSSSNATGASGSSPVSSSEATVSSSDVTGASGSSPVSSSEATMSSSNATGASGSSPASSSEATVSSSNATGASGSSPASSSEATVSSSNATETSDIDTVTTSSVASETSPSSIGSTSSENATDNVTTVPSSISTSPASTDGSISLSSNGSTSSPNLTTESLVGASAPSSSAGSSVESTSEITSSSSDSISSSVSSTENGMNATSEVTTSAENSTEAITTSNLSTDNVLTTDMSSSESSSASSTGLYSSTDGGSSSSMTESEMTTDETETTEFTPPKTSKSTLKDMINKEMTPKQCKRKKKKPKCESSEYGCCFDGISFATGPFSAGCPEITTCKETKYGCCPDEVSPAEGPKFKGCPVILCNETLFGCCPDGKSTATGNDFEGCPAEATTLPFNCKTTEFGCCPDGLTPASGPNSAGCFECIEGSGDCDLCNQTTFGCCPDGMKAASGPDFAGCMDDTTTDEGFMTFSSTDASSTITSTCEESQYGCCPDNTTAALDENFGGCNETLVISNCSESKHGCCPDGNTTALGPNNEGCKMACESEPFGCCSDNVTAAHGPNKEGCCLNTAYGCCPDNIVAASGANLEGCGCQYSPYGCCPDNTTAARGPKNEGCGCDYTEFGCCPNKYTPASGPNFQGCPCYTYQFGCCPDGITKAKGPSYQGCSCDDTEFGCCGDGKTPAQNASRICGCEASKYGCCPDGIMPALGEDFQGCAKILLKPGEACSIPKSNGPCRDFTVKWFFDAEYGSCSRFWYGGCEGNANRFKSSEECTSTCVEPPGRAACFLPKNKGPCDGFYPMWYYDAGGKQCRQFIYGGCLGNNNKFQTFEECEQLCVLPDRLEPCEQTADRGPCEGNYTRWYFNKQDQSCQQFNYGGCKGNHNNFLTEIACQQQCLQPGKTRQECLLPRTPGNCTERQPRWFFDASVNRCAPFYYTGCGGNKNNFETRDVCEKFCPPRVEQNLCTLPAVAGECQNYTARWYYNSLENRCRQFYYGGCGGNGNNFVSEASCRYRCTSATPPERETPPPVTYPTTVPYYPPPSPSDICRLAPDHGPCSRDEPSWYFDAVARRCQTFVYGGCDGNRNRFGSEAECEAACGFLKPEDPTRQPATGCNAAAAECAALQCPFGVTKHVDSNNCEVCSCFDPCAQYICQSNSQCAIEYYRDEQDQVQFRPVCRLLVKPGSCPTINGTQRCTLECRTDADCSGESKCCVHECGAMCVELQSVIPTTAEPLTTEPHVPLKLKETAPLIDQSVESDIVAEEGHYATLRCIAHGYPKPVINWQKGTTVIDRSGGRYKLVDGVLQVIGLHKSDSGSYICTADNGIPNAAIKEFRLTVKDGVNRSAEIIEDAVPKVVVTLGAPAILQCFAYGYPSPTVTWWKEEKLLDMLTDQYEQRRDHSLAIHRVTLRLLGPYTCQAYNGQGRAASWTTTLNAVGLVAAPAPDELAYTIYLVPPPQVPPQTDLSHVTQPTPGAVVTTRRVFSVPISTSIDINATTFQSGSDVSIPCNVDGYPVPTVTWYKDNVPITASSKITISESNRLLIRNADASDSGTYKCAAVNAYSSAFSSISVIVEGAYVHPDCYDSPEFANCPLIVQARYCKHKFYSKFCCKSCTLAGQLPSHSDHLS